MGKRESADNKVKHPEEKTLWVLGIAAAGLGAPAFAFYVFFRSYSAGGPVDWATFGTFYSGIATPVIAFCSALIFFRSIVVQRKEFEETRKEMQKATEFQKEASKHNYNTIRQEQLERSISKAKELQNHHYSMISNWSKALKFERWKESGEKLEMGELGEVLSAADKVPNKEEVKEHVEKYSVYSLHIADMINNFLEADGDVYLRLEDLELLNEQSKIAEPIIDSLQLHTAKNISYYRRSLKTLNKRFDHEIGRYS